MGLRFPGFPPVNACVRKPVITIIGDGSSTEYFFPPKSTVWHDRSVCQPQRLQVPLGRSRNNQTTRNAPGELGLEYNIVSCGRHRAHRTTMYHGRGSVDATELGEGGAGCGSKNRATFWLSAATRDFLLVFYGVWDIWLRTHFGDLNSPCTAERYL